MDEIFKTDDEPKKRALTPRQLEALAKGRAKREEQRLLKLEKEGIKENNVIAQKEKTKKKSLLKQQEVIKQDIINNNDELKKSKELESFKVKYRNEINNKLETIDDPIIFKQVRSFFSKYKIDDIKDIDSFKKQIDEDYKKLKKD